MTEQQASPKSGAAEELPRPSVVVLCCQQALDPNDPPPSRAETPDASVRITIVPCSSKVESWHLLNDVPSRLTYKMRYSGEVEYELSFVSSVSLRYILEDEFNVKNPLQSYILLAGYKHQL